MSFECFHIMMAELSGWDRALWSTEPKICTVKPIQKNFADPYCIEKFAIIIIIIMHTTIKCDFLCLEKAFQYLWSLQIYMMLTLHQVSSRLECAAKVSA